MLFHLVRNFVSYQGMRVKTPARINNAASSAATTAPLSIDSNQPLREVNATVLVLMFSPCSLLVSCSTYGRGPHVIHARLAVPKLLAYFLDLVRCDAADNHQCRRGKFFFLRQARNAGPANLLL